jgi:hypothetical protein
MVNIYWRFGRCTTFILRIKQSYRTLHVVNNLPVENGVTSRKPWNPNSFQLGGDTKKMANNNNRHATLHELTDTCISRYHAGSWTLPKTLYKQMAPFSVSPHQNSKPLSGVKLRNFFSRQMLRLVLPVCVNPTKFSVTIKCSPYQYGTSAIWRRCRLPSWQQCHWTKAVYCLVLLLRTSVVSGSLLGCKTKYTGEGFHTSAVT